MAQFFIVVFIVFCSTAQAQFSARNLMENQYGKLPDTDQSNFSSLYNKLIVNYRFDDLKATAGVQAFQTPFTDRNYIDPSWLGVNYKKKSLEINLGNFYKTLGRGLLLRSYEVQGGLLEDQGFRTKHYFYRDILGASASIKLGKVNLTGLWGHPLSNVYPPNQPFENKRSDEIAALNVEYRLFKQKLALTGLNVKNEFENSNYGAINISGRILPSLSYFTAYAQFLGDSKQKNKKITAFYGNLNYSMNKIGFSLELKNYQNFLIASGINEPPALVREHSYLVLNRSTHVLLPDNESGVQFEFFYQLNNDNLITLNYTQANNDLFKTYKYSEWFAEWATVIFNDSDLKIFIDQAEDPLKNQSQRFSTGFLLDHKLVNRRGLALEFNYQVFQREGQHVMQEYVMKHLILAGLKSGG